MIDSQKIIESLIEWINLNLTDPLPIDKIALRAGYTKWHLQRMFHRVKGTTINAYIRNCRLDKASENLITSLDSVSTVALKNGFNSSASFSRAFAQRFHVSPTQFRRQKSHSYNE